MSEDAITHTGSPTPSASRALMLLALALCLVALPFLVQALGQPALVPLATRVLIYAIAAASLNLALGFGGMVSFGHAAFFGVGGYVVGILYRSYVDDSLFLGLIPGTSQLLITLPAAILVGGLLALLIGALCLRTSGVQFIMITLAFAQMLFFLFVSLKAYGGDDGMIDPAPQRALRAQHGRRHRPSISSASPSRRWFSWRSGASSARASAWC
jgi:branched-chain amino acid transport system permease protein